jgi:dihydroneopterin aldolase/2-amino-4-hydroxy-6-hydroxymethyldihydropteridine diphosphokinase
VARAFIGIGSNIDPAENVRAALRLLAGRTRLVGISMVYLTGALGRPEQAPYYNCVAEIETGAAPAEIKYGILRGIEETLGRKRTQDRYAPRTIDLDLIVYGDLTLEAEGMDIPDPEILERPFLAVPLFELAPDLVLPRYRVPIREIAVRLGRDGMQPLEEYAGRLRKELESIASLPETGGHSGDVSRP